MSAGADDVETADDGSIEVMTAPEQFDDVHAALIEARLAPEVAEVVQRPSNETPVVGEDAEKVMRLIDALEELDDVQEVFTNASFDEESLAQTEAKSRHGAKAIRAIGIDPGSRVTGIGVVETQGQTPSIFIARVFGSARGWPRASWRSTSVSRKSSGS